MDSPLLDAMAREGFEMVLALHDRQSGLRGFLALHDTSAGPALGGIRRWSYRNESEALRDCLRLARAMSHKCVLAGLPLGGAKLVLLDRGDVDWEAGYRHLGRVIEGLGGRYEAGPDVGTGPRELAWAAAETGHVTRPGPEGPGLLAESTAAGVLAGMGAALAWRDGRPDWPARRVVVQGLGAVGLELARRLVELGATVIGTDIDPARVKQAVGLLGIETADPSRELDVSCDVFAPCALGGILHDLSIQRLRCGLVAGGANNVLARTEHGDHLHRRGILFAPDVVLTSGALIRGAVFQLEGRREPLEQIGARVARTLRRVLERAAEEDRSPARVAVEEAERTLAARRSDGEAALAAARR